MKPLYLECADPNGGLGNRITVICAGYATAKILGMEPKLYWTAQGHGCRAEYTDLYKPMDSIELVDFIPDSEDTFFAWVYAGGGLRFHEKWLGKSFATPHYWSLFREAASQLQLIDSLQIPDLSGFNALHVRGNYQPRAIDPSFYHDYKPAGLFLSVDNKDSYDSLIKGSVDCWSLSVPTTNYDLMNRTPELLQDAARDMMMLTRASSILTIGKDSTFRNLACLGYGIPSFALNTTYSP
jgi:hypothetical protein